MNRLLFLLITIFSLAGCSSTGERAPVADITQGKKTVNYKSAGKITGQKSYKVKAGDTLYAISWRSGLDVNTLAARNNLAAPYDIYEGQILSLVGSKRSKPAAVKKASVNSDLSSQTSSKKVQTGCTGQSCGKKSSQALVKKNSKAYSGNQSDKKLVKNSQITNKKVSGWSWPVKGRLTKTFSSSQAGMKGISLSHQRGTFVQAAASGKVVYAGNGLRGYGNLIIIKHNSDYLSAYAHNEKLLVRENEFIKMGQKIALMGDSGTDRVQLHFEIRYRGKSVDPLRYLPKR